MTVAIDPAAAAGADAAGAHDPDAVLAAKVERSLGEARSAARRRSVIVVAGQVLIPVALLVLWEVASRRGWVENPEAFYSKPTDVARYLSENVETLWRHLRATLQAAVLGIGLGVTLGGLSGLLLGRWRLADRMVDPLVTVLAGLPRIALAPVFLMWFGITLQAKVALSFSIVYFIMLINIRGGVRTVDQENEQIARLLGGNRWQVIWKVVLPGIVPVTLGSVRLALAFGFLGVIASEMVGAREGLGILIVQFSQTLNPSGVFGVLAVLAAVTSGLNGLIRIVESRTLRWRDDG